MPFCRPPLWFYSLGNYSVLPVCPQVLSKLISAGLPDPSIATFPRLTYLLKGIHRSLPDHARGRRLPITPEVLEKMHAVWLQEPMTFDKVMLCAAGCLGFFGFMRSGEFTSTAPHTSSGHMLSLGDISIDSRVNPQVVVVHLRHSKTDPFSAGVFIYLGRTRGTLCPVSAMLSYLAIRSSEPGPLFVFADGTPLSREKLVTHLCAALSKAGISTANFSGHSFRIGAASTAARAGFSNSFIQTLGRWKSDAFTRYIS